MTHDQDHYKQTNIEPIDVIEDYELGFCLGNAIKYILRADFKDSKREDLEKALWYINRELDNMAEEDLRREGDDPDIHYGERWNCNMGHIMTPIRGEDRFVEIPDDHECLGPDGDGRHHV